jgi:hypothetical protein
LHLVAPGLGIPVPRGIERLVGITVAAQIVSHNPKFFGKVAIDLAHPRQIALREAVNEQDFRAGRVTPLLRRYGQTVGRLHGDRFVLQVLRKARLRHRDQQSGRNRRLDRAAIPDGNRHRTLPLFFVMRQASTHVTRAHPG